MFKKQARVHNKLQLYQITAFPKLTFKLVHTYNIFVWGSKQFGAEGFTHNRGGWEMGCACRYKTALLTTIKAEEFLCRIDRRTKIVTYRTSFLERNNQSDSKSLKYGHFCFSARSELKKLQCKRSI